MNKILLLFLSFVLAAGAAQSSMAQDMLLAAANAETVKAEGERVKKKLAKKKDRRECRKVRSTGSRIPERVCRRESEWRRIEENSRQSVEDSLERSRRDTNSLDG